LLPSAAQMLVDVFLRRLRPAGRVMEQNSPASPALILLGDGYTVNTAAGAEESRR